MNKTLKQAVYKERMLLINFRITDLLAIRKNSDNKEIVSLN